MPYPSETYLNLLRTLGNMIPSEFESLYAQLEGFLSAQHNDDGSHSAITADGVTLRENGMFTLSDGSVWRVKDGAPTMVAAGQTMAFQTRLSAGQTATTRLQLADSLLVGPGYDAEVQVINAALTAERLRFPTQRAYAASPGDVAALNDSLVGPQASVYRLTSTNSIEGIYDSANVAGLRGQVLILFNASGGNLSLAPLGIVSNSRKIIGGPVTLRPNGSATLLYNTDAQGWQIIATHWTTDGVVQAYTPVWSSASSPQPTGSSLVGQYTRIGGWVNGSVRQTMTSGTTFGSGLWEWTPPVTPAAGSDVVGSAHLFDSGTAHLIGTAMMVSGKFRLVTDNSANNVGPLIPFTFAVDDYLQFNFSYPAA